MKLETNFPSNIYHQEIVPILMIYTSSIGLIHLIVSVLALVFGTWIISAAKGTARHRRIGYLYAISMVILNITAFMTYRLFGGFGPFHVAAIISSLTLFFGLVPAILKRPAGSWFSLHFGFMYWSVIGLYGALAAEVLVRIPQTRFGWMVGLATFLVMSSGAFFFVKYKKNWELIGLAYETKPIEPKN